MTEIFSGIQNVVGAYIFILRLKKNAQGFTSSGSVPRAQVN